MKKELDIELDNTLAEIPGVLKSVEAFLEFTEADGSVKFDICIALEELLTNIVSYAFPDGMRHKIDVSLAAFQDRVECRLKDKGIPFDPFSMPEPNIEADIDEREIGGLGIHFVRETMQSVDYKRLDGYNIATITRRLDVSNDQ